MDIKFRFKQVGDYNFESQVLKNSKPVLVVCYAPESGLSKIVAEIVAEIAEKYKGKLDVFLMHVLDSKDVFFKYRVKEIPTLLHFKDGVLVSKMSNIQLSPKLKSSIENMISGEFLLSQQNLVSITDENFEEELANFDGLAVLNFWVSGMDVCWAMENDLSDLADKYEGKVKIGIADLREAKELATKYRVIDAPTMLFLHKGEELDRIVGLRTKRSIENFIVHHLARI